MITIKKTIGRVVFISAIAGVILTTSDLAIASDISSFDDDFQYFKTGCEHFNSIENQDTLNTKKKKDEKFSQDSCAYELPEMTVEANNSYHTPKKSVYIPSKSEKNVSIDAMALLKRMYIPQLVTSPSGGFTASNGDEISYFVNGNPASPEELSSMNISDVKKVEYLDFPEDANFLSAPHVVNFIVQEYEYGGYTRIGLNHMYIPAYSLEENIFSRWSYKRMTYDVSVAASNSDNDHYYAEKNDIFRFDTGTVERTVSPEDGHYRIAKYPVKLRAQYSHGNTYISNSVGYSYFDQASSFSEGDIRYKGFPLSNNSFESDSPLRLSSVSWDGNGSFVLGNGWTLAALGNLYYSHYDIRSSYSLYEHGDLAGTPVLDIKNFVNENTINGNLRITSNKRFSDVHSFIMSLQSSMEDSKMNYINIDSKKHFDSYTFAFKGGYDMNLQKIHLGTTLGVANEKASMDGINVNTFYPFATVSFNYMPNLNNNINLWMQYSTFSPNISAKNPELVQKNELMYTVGNPLTTPFPRYELALNYFWRITNNFQIFPMFNWNHAFNAFHTVYTPMEDKTAMLTTYENGGHTDDVSLRINFSLELFNRKLHITATPEYRIQSPSYADYPTLHPVEIYSTINGYFGNFYVSANFYSGLSRRYQTQNMDVMVDRPHQYWLSAGWGNGKVRAELYFSTTFKKNCDNHLSIIESPHYSSRTVQFSSYDRALLSVKLSYTFGYGKKINHGDEVNQNVSTAASAVNL